MVCTRTLACYGPVIEHYLTAVSGGKNLNGKFFQILGLDILLDEDLNPWILEINDHPSMNIYLEKDFMGGGVEKTISEIDLYVKKRVVGDSIKLVKKSKENTARRSEFRSLSRIYPNTDDESAEVAVVLTDARKLFYHLALIKAKH